MKTITHDTKKTGFAIFSKILANKKAIQKAIENGEPLSKIKSIKIAKPL